MPPLERCEPKVQKKKKKKLCAKGEQEAAKKKEGNEPNELDGVRKEGESVSCRDSVERKVGVDSDRHDRSLRREVKGGRRGSEG